MAHLIKFEDGEDEPCFCSEEQDHEEPEGDWNMFDEDHDGGDW